jgi:hypothetical protein
MLLKRLFMLPLKKAQGIQGYHLLLAKLTHDQLYREHYYTLARHMHWHVLHLTPASAAPMRPAPAHAGVTMEPKLMPEAPLEKFVLIHLF